MSLGILSEKQKSGPWGVWEFDGNVGIIKFKDSVKTKDRVRTLDRERELMLQAEKSLVCVFQTFYKKCVFLV